MIAELCRNTHKSASPACIHHLRRMWGLARPNKVTANGAELLRSDQNQFCSRSRRTIVGRHRKAPPGCAGGAQAYKFARQSRKTLRVGDRERGLSPRAAKKAAQAEEAYQQHGPGSRLRHRPAHRDRVERRTVEALTRSGSE